MKNVPPTLSARLGAGFILLAALAACHKPIVETTPEPEPVAPATPTPAPKIAAATPAPAPATPEPNYFAPEGVYFLIAAASIETSDGITGLRPGTRAIRQADGRYLADGRLVELRPDQVTNDLRIAGRAAGADQAAQAAIRRSLQAPPPSTPAGQPTPRTPPSVARAAATPRPASGLNAPARQGSNDHYDKDGQMLPHAGRIH